MEGTIHISDILHTNEHNFVRADGSLSSRPFRNAFGQTSLHVACNVARQKSPNALDRRAYSVILLLRDAGRASDSRGKIGVAHKEYSLPHEESVGCRLLIFFYTK